MSRQLLELENVMQLLIEEHRRLLGFVGVQQDAMKKLQLDVMEDATHRQESTRLRIGSLDTRRRLLVQQIAKLSRITGEVTIVQLATLFPQNGPKLLALRNELKALMKQIADRTHIAGRLASAVLGHLNTAMRLLAGAVGQAGTYTKNGVPRVATRIGVMEAVDNEPHRALNIGKSALAVSQAAIQTTSNNIANAGNADYTRQVAELGTNRDQRVEQGIFLGTGVNLDAVQRQIDEALEGRIRSSISDDQAADTSQQWIGRIESTFNELSDQDLSTQLSTFFNSWSDLANKPQDIGLRQVVIQNGAAVAQSMQDLRGQLSSLQSDVNGRIEALANNAQSLAQQAADLNAQIVQAEGGAAGTANGLRDQRDATLKQLSQLVDIKTVPQDNGVVNVYVGSEPLILAGDNFGVSSRTEAVDGVLQTKITFKSNNGEMTIASGQLGALSDVQTKIAGVIGQVDSLANNMIFELNKVHSSGQGLDGFSSVSSANLVDDTTAALNSDQAGLKFAPVSGSFVLHVKNKSSGLVTSTLVQVDLDGKNGNDTTLQSLQSSLNGIANISSSISGGRLSLQADSSDVEISFSQDSSGVLAALGINSFFTGDDARNIAVNSLIQDKPSLLAAAKNGEKGDNQTALAIAGLESASLDSLDGASLKQTYETMVNGVATSASAAKTSAEAAATIRQTLESQRESLSGVSLDEEAINLIKQQRAFQGAAKLISTINEMMNTLMQMT